MQHVSVHSYGDCLHNAEFPPSDADAFGRLKYASKYDAVKWFDPGFHRVLTFHPAVVVLMFVQRR
jgi:hypothetical protein